MAKGLRHLVGCRVKTVECRAPAGDLTIHFADGMTFRVFCDVSAAEDDEFNYLFKEYAADGAWTLHSNHMGRPVAQSKGVEPFVN